MPSHSTTPESLILGIESSCDECSVALLRLTQQKNQVLELATYSQIELHRPFGGVVPEIASRNHLETINPLLDQVLGRLSKPNELSAIAVSNRPGLVGALLVGVSAAKALAYALDKPLLAIHHLEGHAASLYLENPQAQEISYPLLLAIVSGGHTQLHVMEGPPSTWSEDQLKKTLIGRSIDDAAGEAFDKTAKLLGFPYPGGKYLDQSAQSGDPQSFHFPRALPQKDHFDFSFSGLKTAVAVQLQKMSAEEIQKQQNNLSASIQAAIVDALWKKIVLALKEKNCRSLSVVGGVAANSLLRRKLEHESPVPVVLPHLKYCTDNAAMIAMAGAFRFQQGRTLSRSEMLKLNAIANPEF